MVLSVKICARCGKTGDGLLYCARCGTVAYCSTECQRISWPGHREACKRNRKKKKKKKKNKKKEKSAADEGGGKSSQLAKAEET